MFYLTTHSTHFIYGYMASDIWLRTILIVRKETRCRHIGYSYRLTARVILYSPSHRQDKTYHGLCYTSRGALATTLEVSAMVTNLVHRSSPSFVIEVSHLASGEQPTRCVPLPRVEPATDELSGPGSPLTIPTMDRDETLLS